MKLPYRMQLLIFIIFLQINESRSQRADFQPPQNQLNRRFSWSTRAPLTNAINKLAPEVIHHTELITRHATRVEKAILDSLKRDRVDPEAIVQPCDPTISRKYRRAIFRNFALRGFLEPAWNCGTEIRGVKMKHDEEPGYTFNDLFLALFDQGVAIKRRVKQIAVPIVRNYTDADAVFKFTYSTASTNCALNLACLIRQGEHWHQSIVITSNTKEDHLRDGFRSTLREYPRVVSGKLGDPLLMRLPEYDNGTIERVILENSTTLMATWRGPKNPSCFGNVPFEENPAIRDALDLADHSSQLVEDALTSSNLAILVLPLGLNLVPVSLFADVDTVMLLLYTIMSDVLTVVPLAIKGVELVLIDRRRFRSLVTRMLSPPVGNLTVPFAAGGEIWGVECRVREGVGSSGMLLIVISLFFLCIGIGGELVARNYVLSRVKTAESEERNSESSELVGMRSKISSSLVLISDGELGACGVGSKYSSDFGGRK